MTLPHWEQCHLHCILPHLLQDVCNRNPEKVVAVKTLSLTQYTMYCTCTYCEWWMGNLSPSEQYISTNFLSTVYYHLYCKLFAMRVQKISCCRRLKSNSNCNPTGNVLYLHLVRMINSELSHSQHYISHHLYSIL